MKYWIDLLGGSNEVFGEIRSTENLGLKKGMRERRRDLGFEALKFQLGSSGLIVVKLR